MAVIDPDPFMAIAELLHACYCLKVQELDVVPQRCTLLAAQDFELGVSLSEDMCKCGTAWVRIVEIAPSGAAWPAPPEVTTNCTPEQWALTLELGLARCPPIGSVSALPADAEYLTYTRQVMQDAQAMRASVLCCFADVTTMRLKELGSWTPFGPEGLCGGGTMTVKVQVLRCNECVEP